MYEDVLSAFDGFLRERALVRSGLECHYVRWAGDFLAFAAEMRREGRRVGFEETLAESMGSDTVLDVTLCVNMVYSRS